MNPEWDVIVIGSGLGGLATSASLAKEGFKVKIFERLHQPGGFLGTFKRNGYWFEASTHQIGAAFSNEQFLKPELDRLELDIPFISLDHAFEAIAFDSDHRIRRRYPVKSGWDNALSSFIHCFPGDKEEISRLFTLIAGIATDSLQLRQAKKAGNPVNPQSYPHFNEFKGKSFADLLRGIANEEVKFLISQFCFYYVCCYPSKIPAVFMSNLIANLMLSQPLFIKGGTRVLIGECIKTIEKYGGQVAYHSPVAEILLAGGKAAGIQLENGEKHYSRYIVSNINAWLTYEKLIKTREFYSPELIAKLKAYQPSKSVFQVYLGLPFRLEDYGYSFSTLFFSGKRSVDEMYHSCFDRESNSFLVTNYTRMDPDFAQNGKSSIVLTEYRDDFRRWGALNGENYRREKEKAQNELIGKFGEITHIPLDNPEISVAATPRTLGYYSGNIDGAAFGAEICSFSTDRPVENLFLAGVDATYAGSVVSSFDSGINVAETIKDLG